MPEQKPEYPTPQQIKETFEAYKKGGTKALAELLKRKREESKKTSPNA